MDTAQIDPKLPAGAASQQTGPQIGGDANGILSTVQQILRTRGHLDQDDCSLQFRDGELTLHGTVPSFYHKQLAQELVRRVKGVTCVTNLLQVKPR